MNKKSYFAFLHPLYWGAFFLFSLFWLIIHLPLRMQVSIGRMLGLFIYFFPTQLKKIAKKNIALCFPTLSSFAQTALLKNNFLSLGLGIIEATRAWWTPAHKLTQSCKMIGIEHLKNAYAKKKGVILLGPHFTSLEIVGRLMSLQYQFAIMYRPHKNKLIHFLHERFRQKYYTHAISRNNMRELLRTLEKNMAIWYAYDIDGGAKRSVFAPFFNIETASLTTVSRIVKKTGASIIPMAFYRSADGLSYEVHLYPPIESFPSNDLIKDATKLNHALQKAIEKKPDQYVWQYKRFKTRPKNEARFY